MSQTDVVPAQETQESEMTFLEHLEVLRWHIIRSIVSIALFGIVIFLNKEFIFGRVIFGPKYANFPTYKFFCKFFGTLCEPPELLIQTIQVQEKFITHLKVSIIMGIVISFPYIFWEVWQFIKPGLYPKERKAARGMVGICSFLFILGTLFGYYVVTPFALQWLSGYQIGAGEVTSTATTLSSYVNIMTMWTVPAGIIFELPIVMYFLTKVGLVTPKFLKKYRRLAIVVILIVAAIITPPDPTTQFLIGVPLYILYEISIIISQRVTVAQERLDNA